MPIVVDLQLIKLICRTVIALFIIAAIIVIARTKSSIDVEIAIETKLGKFSLKIKK